MNGRTDVCANKECRHDRTAHHREITKNRANPADAGTVEYFACTAMWCACKTFEPMPSSKEED